jgi:uncharacterized membrane protein
MNQKLGPSNQTPAAKPKPFRKAVFKGLALVAPPLLTLVLFLWAWNTIEGYILRPLEETARYLIFVSIQDIQSDAPGSPINNLNGDPSRVEYRGNDGAVWVKVRNKYVPYDVYEWVEAHPGDDAPSTATAYYYRYIESRYLRRAVVIPVFLLVFILTLYFLGKFIAAGIGRLIWNSIEQLIARVPIISNVYSSVKQVTDFAFNDSEIQFTRIVAVQYPRQGVWSMGFVTGEGMLDVRNAANEPVLSVLMPTSPMPATGFTIMVPKSETIDLNITMDQAIQFCVSCGVVIPHQQQMDGNRSALPVEDATASPETVLSAIARKLENSNHGTHEETPTKQGPLTQDEGDSS